MRGDGWRGQGKQEKLMSLRSDANLGAGASLAFCAKAADTCDAVNDRNALSSASRSAEYENMP